MALKPKDEHAPQAEGAGEDEGSAFCGCIILAMIVLALYKLLEACN